MIDRQTPAPGEISVVVQGPLHEGLTPDVLKSVRRHLPGAELILSTWQGSNVSGLDFDRMVESDDPGGHPQPHDPRFLLNVNRQIVSTRSGLEAASRKYAVKLRTDMLLRGAGWLEIWTRFPARIEEYRLLEQRVLAPTLYSFSPRRSGALFHPSDWFHFGLRTDLLRLWELPLAPEPETSHWYELHPEKNRTGMREMGRYTPEQYIWVHALRKRFAVPFEHLQDWSDEALRVSELALANNFILVEPRHIPLETPRHRVSKGEWSSCYSYGEWRQRYAQLCKGRGASLPDAALLLKKAVRGALLARTALTGKAGGIAPPVSARINP